MQETQAGNAGPEDPLEEEMTTYSILAWIIPWTGESGRLQSMELQRVGQDLATEYMHTHYSAKCTKV